MRFFDWRKVKTHSERVVIATPPPPPKQLCPSTGEESPNNPCPEDLVL